MSIVIGNKTIRELIIGKNEKFIGFVGNTKVYGKGKIIFDPVLENVIGSLEDNKY